MRSHSSATGLHAMRGGRILTEGAVSSPASASSSTSGPKSMAVTFIRSATSSDTRLTTNCPVSRMLRAVSLGPPARPPIPRHTTGGSSENRLKKEKGAALRRPCALSVTTQAIGRGRMVEASSL